MYMYYNCFFIVQDSRPFSRCKFFFFGKFLPPCAPKEELVSLVELAGGQVLTHYPQRADCTCMTLIVFDSMSNPNCHPKHVGACLIGTVPVFWVLDCLSFFKLLDLPYE